MKLNLRGGLGNQIFQIAFAMNKTENPQINMSAVQLREQLKDIPNIRYFNSIILNFFLGISRRLISSLLGKPCDICWMDLYDGYFQYGDITNIINPKLSQHLKRQIVYDEKVESIDIAIHIRGGDYLTEKSQQIYEICDVNYYIKSLEIAIGLLNKKSVNIYIVSNDEEYSNSIIKNLNYQKNTDIKKYSDDEWNDFSLLYRATIAIIPNSTFSMAARMLDAKQITIAPKKWFLSKSKLIMPLNKTFIYI